MPEELPIVVQGLVRIGDLISLMVLLRCSDVIETVSKRTLIKEIMTAKKVPTKLTMQERGSWAESKKLEVLQGFLALGNLTHAAAAANVPLTTAKLWKVSKWWKEMEQELRRSDNIKLNARLRKVVDKALHEMEERMLNGDEVLTKQGEIVRKKITGMDAARIAGSMMDRSLVLEKSLEQERPDEQSIEARLDQIRRDILGLNKKRPPVTIEGDIIDVQATQGEGIGSSEESILQGEDQGGTTVGESEEEGVNHAPRVEEDSGADDSTDHQTETTIHQKQSNGE